jgi:transposase
MLKVDQVHVVRHKVLVDGRSQRAVAKEFGISRVTVRKYVEGATPVRQERSPSSGPIIYAHERVPASCANLCE